MTRTRTSPATTPTIMDEVDELGARGMEVMAVPPPAPAAAVAANDDDNNQDENEQDEEVVQDDDRRSMQRNKSGSTTVTEASDSNSESSVSPAAPSSANSLTPANDKQEPDDADRSAGPPVAVPPSAEAIKEEALPRRGRGRERANGSESNDDNKEKEREKDDDENGNDSSDDDGDSDSESDDDDEEDDDEIMVVGAGSVTVTGAAANALPPLQQRRKFPDEDYVPGGAHNPNPVEASILPLPPNVPRYGQTNRALMPSPLPSPVARRKKAAAAAAAANQSPKKRETENDEEEAAVREAKRRQREEASVSRLVHMAKQQQSFAAAWFAASGVVPLDGPAGPAAPPPTGEPPRRRSRSLSPARSVASASSSSSKRSWSSTGKDDGPVDIDTGEVYDDDDDDDNRSQKSSGSKRKGKFGIFGGSGASDSSSVASGSSRKSSRKAKQIDEEMGLGNGKQPLGTGTPIVFADDDADEHDATSKGFAFLSRSFKKTGKGRKNSLLLYALMVVFAIIVVACAAIVAGTVLSRDQNDENDSGLRPTSGEGGLSSALPAESNPTVSPTSNLVSEPGIVSPSTTLPPTPIPTLQPTLRPTLNPTSEPTAAPTNLPSTQPSPAPSSAPSPVPTLPPSFIPTTSPTFLPTPPPSTLPTSAPTEAPSFSPSEAPSAAPSEAPSLSPSAVPSIAPSAVPTITPSAAPTVSFAPSQIPSLAPSTQFAALDLELLGAALNGTGVGGEFGFAVDLNADGTILAVGARVQDSQAPRAGQVEVFRLETENGNQEWRRMGDAIQGVEDSDQFGFAVKLNDAGNRMVVSEPGFRTLQGSLRTFEWQSASLQWEQVGEPLRGSQRFELFGGSLDLSADGNIMVVGAPFSPLGRARNVGQVRVYSFDNVALEWNLIGSPMQGESFNDRYGWSVSMTRDGSMIAAGSPFNGGGYVRVHRLVPVNATWSDWIPVGSGGADSRIFSPVYDQGGLFGSSVSLARGKVFGGNDSDGPRLAIGAPNFSNEQLPNESFDYGMAVVYDLTRTEKWRLMGSAILGDASDDMLGWSVALNDEGNLLSVGSPGNSDKGEKTGAARVYRWLDNVGSWDGSQAVVGRGKWHDFGLAVATSADGRTVAVGAPKESVGNNDEEDDAELVDEKAPPEDGIGYTRVYQLPY